MKYLAPSILSADFTNLSQQIKLVEKGGADWIHCDVMDGQFVPNLTFGPLIVDAANKITQLPIDVHLMIITPDNLIEDFINAGADCITVHQETVVHLNRTLAKIKDLNCKAGVAINPATPVSCLENVLELIDLVLIMSVNPGYGSQSFIENSLKKIDDLSKLKINNGYNFLIEVDGGINSKTIKKIKDAGCEVFVAGSSIFNSDNITAAASELKNLIME